MDQLAKELKEISDATHSMSIKEQNGIIIALLTKILSELKKSNP